MKVVKLNRRFRMHKEHGHAVALRFTTWNDRAREVERVTKDTFGTQYTWSSTYESWHGYFGKANSRTSSRPYWITFRNPADLTLIMMKLNFQ
jgi:hypothetical protein